MNTRILQSKKKIMFMIISIVLVVCMMIPTTFVSARSFFTISVTSSGSGQVTPAATNTVAGGENFTINLVPNEGYEIGSLTVDGSEKVVTKTGGSYTFKNVNTNHKAKATFIKSPSSGMRQITATKTGSGTITNEGTKGYKNGSSITYTAKAESGWKLSAFTVDGRSVNHSTKSGLYTFNNVTENHMINAVFVQEKIQTYSISASAGSGGTVSGDAKVNEGQNATITIMPKSGYTISSVVIDGKSVNVSSPAGFNYTFRSVSANHKVSAKFAQDTYTINVSANAGGSVVGNQNVAKGANSSFKITPASGYVIDSITANGQSVVFTNTGDSYTFRNVSSDCSLVVNFGVVSHNPTVNDTNTNNNDDNVEPNDEVTVETAAPTAAPVATSTPAVELAEPTAAYQTVKVFTNPDGKILDGNGVEVIDTIAMENGGVLKFVPEEGKKVLRVRIDDEDVEGVRAESGIVSFDNVSKEHSVSVTFGTMGKNMYPGSNFDIKVNDANESVTYNDDIVKAEMTDVARTTETSKQEAKPTPVPDVDPETVIVHNEQGGNSAFTTILIIFSILCVIAIILLIFFAKSVKKKVALPENEVMARRRAAAEQTAAEPTVSTETTTEAVNDTEAASTENAESTEDATAEPEEVASEAADETPTEQPEETVEEPKEEASETAEPEAEAAAEPEAEITAEEPDVDLGKVQEVEIEEDKID